MNDVSERISRKLRRMSLLSLNDPNNKTVLAKMDMAKQNVATVQNMLNDIKHIICIKSHSDI